MADKIKTIISALLALIILANIASAITIRSITADTISPNKEGTISVEIKNNLNDTAEDISMVLDFTNLPFIPIGSSEDSISELDEDDTDELIFAVKATNDITPGDYKMPFILSYIINDAQKQSKGAIGLTVKANPELSFSLSSSNPVINQQGKLTLKIVNKGLADARFVSLKLIQNPSDYTLLSDSEVYIGKISSDDFETSAFDIVYKSQNPIFTAILEYSDFDNKKITQTINLPVTVYTPEKAIELGIISKNNTSLYIGIAVALIVIWFVYRVIRKRIRRARSKKGG